MSLPSIAPWFHPLSRHPPLAPHPACVLGAKTDCRGAGDGAHGRGHLLHDPHGIHFRKSRPSIFSAQHHPHVHRHRPHPPVRCAALHACHQRDISALAPPYASRVYRLGLCKRLRLRETEGQRQRQRDGEPETEPELETETETKTETATETEKQEIETETDERRMWGVVGVVVASNAQGQQALSLQCSFKRD